MFMKLCKKINKMKVQVFTVYDVLTALYYFLQIGIAPVVSFLYL